MNKCAFLNVSIIIYIDTSIKLNRCGISANMASVMCIKTYTAFPVLSRLKLFDRGFNLLQTTLKDFENFLNDQHELLSVPLTLT